MKHQRNIKFYSQYQINIQIIFSDFDENQKNGSGVGRTGNETRRKFLKNSSSLLKLDVDITFFFFLECISRLLQGNKKVGSSNLVAKFQLLEVCVTKNAARTIFFQNHQKSFLDLFSEVTIIYYSKIDGSANLLGQF